MHALSPPISGERVGVEGWGGNGHLLEAYSTEPTCKPQSKMCSFWDLRRYAVAVVAVAAVGRGKLKNVRYLAQYHEYNAYHYGQKYIWTNSHTISQP